MDDKMMKKIALFRYALIAPLINDTSTADSKTEYYQELAKKKYVLPNGREVMYAAGTFKSWYLEYQKKGFDALYPKTRSDIGMTRTMDQETKHRIHELKEKFPYITATMVYQKLLEEGFITTTSTSLTTITRYIRRNNLKSKQLTGKERKAFEMEHINDCWQADTSHALRLTIEGKKHKTYLILFLDDASRMIVGYDFFFEDNAVNMQKVFKKAIAKYGKPKRIYVDNGGPYKNEQLQLICASLGIVLINTKPYDAAAKGKVERTFRTIKDHWMRVIDWEQLHSLEEVRKSLEKYLNTQYLNKKHSALSTSPKQRFVEEQERIQYVDREELEEYFLHTENRRVRNDGTISLSSKYYEVPQMYIGMVITIKYNPSNKEELYIYDGKQRKEKIVPLRRIENAHAKRNIIDFTSIGGE